MFAPIRPRPTNPIRMPFASCRWSSRPHARRVYRSAPGQRLAKSLLERQQALFRIVEMDAEDRQVMALDRREVALRLGIDQPAERIRPAGDRTIDPMVRRQLDEPADRRTALVELARRMEEARAVAGRRRAAGRVAEEGPDAIHRRGRVG